MFASHFGLRENPFGPTSNLPSPFPSHELDEALKHFTFVRATGEPFLLLVGEVGTGKSTALEAMLRSLDPGTRVAVLRHSTLEAKELLVEILRRFGLEPKGTESKPELLSRLEKVLAPKESGPPAVLIIDEAHLLPLSSLEELRLLSNLSHANRPLLQTCLVGQPELAEKLRHDRMRPLRQRVAVRYTLGPLSRDETAAYLAHHLREAGAEHPSALFTEGAADAIHEISGGLPREVNVIASQAMLTAYLENSRVVTAMYVRSTGRDFGFEGLHCSYPSEAIESREEPPVAYGAAETDEDLPVEPPERMFEETAVGGASEIDFGEESDAPEIPWTEGRRGSQTVRTALAAAAVLALVATAAVVVVRRTELIDAWSFVLPPPPAVEPAPRSSPLDSIPAPPLDALLWESTEAPISSSENETPIPTAAPSSTTSAPMSVRPPDSAAAVEPPEEPVLASPVTASAADRLELGADLARSGRLAEAVRVFREAVAIDPAYPKAQYNLGLSLLESGQPREAVTALRRAANLEPENGPTHRTLGIALREAGELDEAVSAFQRAVALGPEDAVAFRHLSHALRRLGNIEEATRTAARAVALQPNDPELQYQLGFFLHESGQLTAARIAFEKAVELDPDLAIAHYGLGVTLLELGEPTVAQQRLAEARRLGFTPR